MSFSCSYCVVLIGFVSNLDLAYDIYCAWTTSDCSLTAKCCVIMFPRRFHVNVVFMYWRVHFEDVYNDGFFNLWSDMFFCACRHMNTTHIVQLMGNQIMHEQLDIPYIYDAMQRLLSQLKSIFARLSKIILNGHPTGCSQCLCNRLYSIPVTVCCVWINDLSFSGKLWENVPDSFSFFSFLWSTLCSHVTYLTTWHRWSNYNHLWVISNNGWGGSNCLWTTDSSHTESAFMIYMIYCNSITISKQFGSHLKWQEPWPKMVGQGYQVPNWKNSDLSLSYRTGGVNGVGLDLGCSFCV